MSLPESWSVDVDEADLLLLSKDEREALDEEVKRTCILAWQSANTLRMSFYGVGDGPGPLLGALAERSRSSREKDQ